MLEQTSPPTGIKWHTFSSSSSNSLVPHSWTSCNKPPPPTEYGALLYTPLPYCSPPTLRSGHVVVDRVSVSSAGLAVYNLWRFLVDIREGIRSLIFYPRSNDPFPRVSSRLNSSKKKISVLREYLQLCLESPSSPSYFVNHFSEPNFIFSPTRLD